MACSGYLHLKGGCGWKLKGRETKADGLQQWAVVLEEQQGAVDLSSLMVPEEQQGAVDLSSLMVPEEQQGAVDLSSLMVPEEQQGAVDLSSLMVPEEQQGAVDLSSLMVPEEQQGAVDLSSLMVPEEQQGAVDLSSLMVPEEQSIFPRSPANKSQVTGCKNFWSEEGHKSCSVSEAIMEQINGSVQVERVLLYTFLEASSDCKFREQLQCLQSQGMVSFLRGSCYDDDEVELQTDGNRSGHMQNGEPVFEHEVDEEVIRRIATQLAAIGDRFDQDIKARVVNDLVQHFLNENLSGEEITQHMSQAVEGLVQAMPSDMDREKAMLVLAMLLTKKIANTMPSLLQRAFSTTLNYINQQLRNCIARLLRD
ncbi:BH3-interacting domain death agonist [Indicator indicator]|uniref:BH3-interacting domain death agonist n=1 Tax=Indicator indicator TaxID=1002788 RepID=UPI0023E04221|nr:BH3-interacting domain death agonist [Indicator indicator]